MMLQTTFFPDPSKTSVSVLFSELLWIQRSGKPAACRCLVQVYLGLFIICTNSSLLVSPTHVLSGWQSAPSVLEPENHNHFGHLNRHFQATSLLEAQSVLRGICCCLSPYKANCSAPDNLGSYRLHAVEPVQALKSVKGRMQTDNNCVILSWQSATGKRRLG